MNSFFKAGFEKAAATNVLNYTKIFADDAAKKLSSKTSKNIYKSKRPKWKIDDPDMPAAAARISRRRPVHANP